MMKIVKNMTKGSLSEIRCGINKFQFFIACLSCLVLISSCQDDILDGDIVTSTEETVGEFIENESNYSEFYRMLDTTHVIGLLRAYGEYTCFLPDNNAMTAFYASNNKTCLGDFSLEELTETAQHHIMKDTLKTSAFVQGLQATKTLSGRNLNINFVSDSAALSYYVNDSSKVVKSDIMLHNGVVHEIDKVIDPTEYNIAGVIKEDASFSLFYSALVATGLDERLKKEKDDTYPDEFADYETLSEQRDETADSPTMIPRERKYGYTVLMESDKTYKSITDYNGLSFPNGITSIDDLKRLAASIYDEVFPTDAGISDITDSRNSLNRYIAYHLFDKKIIRQFFIEAFDNTGMNNLTDQTSHSVKTIDMYEYIETMCPNTLVEVRTRRDQTNDMEYDWFNYVEETGEFVRLTDNTDNDALNGVYHEIDNILCYNKDFFSELSSKRLRMNPASFFPEFMNNDIRVVHENSPSGHVLWKFPNGYLDRLESSEVTEFGYFSSEDTWCNYQGDEVFMNQCMYDITMETLPIPAGTYEVRFGYKANASRGVVQLYWDGLPCGIPLDLSITADQPEIGYVKPGTDALDVKGYENDKMMRNRGYMKAPACFKGISGSQAVNARDNSQCLRRILGTFTFTEAGTHTVRARGLSVAQFMFDYMEFVPTEYIESEDVN